MSRLKKSGMAAAVALLSVVALAAPAPEAQATAWNCQMKSWEMGGSTYCLNGDGYYRVGIICRQSFWPNLYTRTVYGPYIKMASNNQVPSTANCSWPTEVRYGSVWAGSTDKP